MKSLFQETRINSMSLANRLVRSATWMAMAGPDGECTERLLDCYETLAQGEIGLIISGFAFVSREGQGPPGQLGIYNDDLVDGLRVLTGKVHDAGGKIAAQIVHCGAKSLKENNSGLDILGPSEMTNDDIRRVVDDYGAAAVRARDAGFDAIQLHYAHGYLGSQFLSPHFNKRDDEYGGPIERRARFLKETYLVVREAVGDDYPVMAKLNIEDFLDNGLKREEGLYVADLLCKLGLDAIEASGGMAESGKLGPARRIKLEQDEAYFEANAAAVKEAAGDMAVLLVGGLRDPSRMAAIHERTGLDYFSMSRPFIREPHLVKRWKEGDTSPAQCVSCSGCFLTVKQGRGIFCIKTRKKAKEKPA